MRIMVLIYFFSSIFLSIRIFFLPLNGGGVMKRPAFDILSNFWVEALNWRKWGRKFTFFFFFRSYYTIFPPSFEFFFCCCFHTYDDDMENCVVGRAERWQRFSIIFCVIFTLERKKLCIKNEQRISEAFVAVLAMAFCVWQLKHFIPLRDGFSYQI